MDIKRYVSEVCARRDAGTLTEPSVRAALNVTKNSIGRSLNYNDTHHHKRIAELQMC